STRTSAAKMRACARSRDGTRPRSRSNLSSRIFSESFFTGTLSHSCVCNPYNLLLIKQVTHVLSAFSTELCTVMLKNSSDVNGNVARDVRLSRGVRTGSSLRDSPHLFDNTQHCCRSGLSWA